MTKTCSGCHQVKVLADFYKHRGHADGLAAQCKECSRRFAKTYYSTENGRRRVLDSSLKWQRSSRGKAMMKIAAANRMSDPSTLAARRLYMRRYYYNRLKTDVAFRACKNARARINAFVQGKVRYSHSLGCTFVEFKAHIEDQFQLGMTWENYGDWEIDHKHPVSVAYSEGPESFARACRLENLQPLWAKDNRSKSNGINYMTYGKSESSSESESDSTDT